MKPPGDQYARYKDGVIVEIEGRRRNEHYGVPEHQGRNQQEYATRQYERFQRCSCPEIHVASRCSNNQRVKSMSESLNTGGVAVQVPSLLQTLPFLS